jgi:hypothetical protein
MIIHGHVMNPAGQDIENARARHACNRLCNAGRGQTDLTNSGGNFYLSINWDFENRHVIQVTAEGYTGQVVLYQAVTNDANIPGSVGDIVLQPIPPPEEDEEGGEEGENEEGGNGEEEGAQQGAEMGAEAGAAAGELISQPCGSDCKTKDSPCERHVLGDVYCYQHRGIGGIG